MSGYTRRGFLRVTAQGTAALALVGVSGTLLGGCDPKALAEPDANGLRLQTGFTSRIIATTGQVVAGTTHVWHTAPDGGACFPLADGGWSYVSNCEWVPGGASYVRFASDGTHRRCRALPRRRERQLRRRRDAVGHVAELRGAPDGAGSGSATPSVRTPGSSGRPWAASPTRPPPPTRPTRASTSPRTAPTARLYRFVPTTWGDLSAGSLQVLTRSADVLSWQVVPDPSAAATPTKDQVPDTVRFNGGEGADMSLGKLIFTTKGDNRVWRYDPVANTLGIVYDRAVQVNGVLGGVDNVEVSPKGVDLRRRGRRRRATCRSCSCATTARRSRSCRSPGPPPPRSPGRPSTRPAPACTSAPSANPAAPTR